MTVAVLYKLVLVWIGVGLLIFCGRPLHLALKHYFPLYLVGLLLNIVVIAVVLAAMLFPRWMVRAASWFENKMICIGFWKESETRMEKVREFTGNYKRAVDWLKGQPGKLLVLIAVTFLQRCSVFLLTYMVYRGFGESGASVWEVMILQASVYIAVDMLPLPWGRRDHGTHVPVGVCLLFFTGISDPVDVSEPGTELLFSAGGKPACRNME